MRSAFSRVPAYLLLTLGAALLYTATRPSAIPADRSGLSPAEKLALRQADESATYADAVTLANGAICILFGGWRLARPKRHADHALQDDKRGRKPTRRHVLILVLIMIVAVLVRLPGLGHGFWYDELFTIQHYLPISPRMIAADYDAPNNHILYSIALRMWDGALPASLTGDARGVAWRLLSVLFGVGGVAVVYVLATRDRVDSPGFGLCAAGVFGLMPICIDYSQQLRGYALAMMLAAAATAAMLHALKLARRWWLYSVLTFAMLYTHPLCIFVCMGHVLTALLRCDQDVDRHGFAVATTAAAMLTAQFYGPLIPDALRHAAAQDAAGTATIGAFLIAACRELGACHVIGWAAPIVGTAMFVFAIATLRRGRIADWAVISPGLILFLACAAVPAIRQTRYLAIAAPSVAHLLAIALSSMSRQRATTRWVLPVVISVLFGFDAARIWRYPVQAIREALRAAVVDDGAAERTVVIGLGAPEGTFYGPSALKAFSAQDLTLLMEKHRIGAAVVPYPRTWLDRPEQAELRAMLRTRFRLPHEHAGRLADDQNVLRFERAAGPPD